MTLETVCNAGATKLSGWSALQDADDAAQASSKSVEFQL